MKHKLSTKTNNSTSVFEAKSSHSTPSQLLFVPWASLLIIELKVHKSQLQTQRNEGFTPKRRLNKANLAFTILDFELASPNAKDV